MWNSSRHSRSLRHRRPREVSLAEERPHSRIPSRNRPPSSPHQHFRRNPARAQHTGICRSQIFHRKRICLPQHPPHHRKRLRGCRGNVSGDHPRPWKSAPQRGRQNRLLSGFLWKNYCPDRVRTARRRAWRDRARRNIHFRPHIPRRKLQHSPTLGRVLDDRAWNGILWHNRQHGPRRGICQILYQVCPWPFPRRHRVPRVDVWQRTYRAPQLRCRQRVCTPHLHRGSQDSWRIGTQIWIPRPLGHRPSERTRTLSRWRTLQETCHPDWLSQGNQGILHEAQRRWKDRPRDGCAFPPHRRNYRRLGTRGILRQTRCPHRRTQHPDERHVVVSRYPP